MKHADEKKWKSFGGMNDENYGEKKEKKKIKKRKKSKKLKDETDEDSDVSVERNDVTSVKVRKRKNYEMNEEEKKKKELEEEKIKAKYEKWNRGLKQIENEETEFQANLKEIEKPFARFVDDEERDKELKNVLRAEDPMLMFLEKDNEDKSEKKKKKKKTVYEGRSEPIPNRYDILPGNEWDGVDRSNGFEQKYFQSLQLQKAKKDEYYKWSVEDM
ncbi:hypothetical protein SNEBB_010019 [Seison nebaliae]|nr:hypothetical protein SNEBB_010019 [Seison nebaliae]